MRLLAVDDDATFREEIADILTHEGHQVVTAASVPRAIEALEAEEFELILTDLKMPHHSGLELLREVRRRWPRTQVVVITGYATIENALKATKLGAFDYLEKPIRPAHLSRVLELVRRHLASVETRSPPRDPAELARVLAGAQGYEVLLVSRAPPSREIPRVTHLPLDPENPYRIHEAVEDFVQSRQRAAVVLADIDQVLARHREEDASKLLEQVRTLLRGKGPLAVGYNPTKITASGALAVRASIVASESHTTLESMANPIRVLVLRRLAEGPCTFMQAMEAAQLDDTSKIAFHLRKLVESGLVSHAEEEPYRLTKRGEGAIEVLREIDGLDSERVDGNCVFTVRTEGRPAA